MGEQRREIKERTGGTAYKGVDSKRAMVGSGQWLRRSLRGRFE